jgi:DNA-binding transcriptional MerR regulator
MRILEAAKSIGVSADMIRRLEKAGKIQLSRDLNGHRRLTIAQLDRLRQIIFPEPPAHETVPGSGG